MLSFIILLCINAVQSIVKDNNINAANICNSYVVKVLQNNAAP